MSIDVHSHHLKKIERILRTIETNTRIKPLETLVLLVYPITIFLGQLISITSFEQTKNYYTNKHNLINTLFVKKGWFWTIITLIYLKIQHGRLTPQLTPFIVRILLSTLWWYFFTQWFFGIPLMDRIFLFTGGACQYDSLISSKGEILGTIGSGICRRLKGVWAGGHDPSGHVFLLVHSSLFLWFEVLEIDLAQQLYEFQKRFKQIQNIECKKWSKFQKLAVLILQTSIILLFLLLGLWWWMLLITSTHFHSFPEKISGLVAAFIGVGIYLIPRFLQ